MHPSAQSLIADLDLHPHPEGGYVWLGFDFGDFRMAKDDGAMCRVIAQQEEAFAACF